MKFSIVTPVYNGEKYLTETLESIINQKGKFHIELIIVDNLSTDGTRDIIEKYATRINDKQIKIYCHSIRIKTIFEKDNGMYDALNKGFKLATGDIFAWANSDDIYLPGAFEVVAKVFEKYKKILWLKGITSYIDENSHLMRQGKPYLYYQKWIQHGIYGRKLYFIQQSSTFWRPEIWHRVNGLNGNLKLAGDFDLWIKFAKHTPLYSLNFNTDCFRFRPGQLSKGLDKYHIECDDILPLPEGIVNRLDLYRKERERLPMFLRPLLYLGLFGIQRFNLINIDVNKEYFHFKIKKFFYYDFLKTTY